MPCDDCRGKSPGNITFDVVEKFHRKVTLSKPFRTGFTSPSNLRRIPSIISLSLGSSAPILLTGDPEHKKMWSRALCCLASKTPSAEFQHCSHPHGDWRGRWNGLIKNSIKPRSPPLPTFESKSTRTYKSKNLTSRWIFFNFNRTARQYKSRASLRLEYWIVVDPVFILESVDRNGGINGIWFSWYGWFTSK